VQINEIAKPVLLQRLVQGFTTCGIRTTNGARRSSKWYASNFHFFTKTWIHSFL